MFIEKFELDVIVEYVNSLLEDKKSDINCRYKKD